jgi:hypothetical protein
MSTTNPAVERLRFCLLREARTHERGSHNADEATTLLTDYAVAAVAGQKDWHGNPLPCEIVLQTLRALSPTLHSAVLTRLRDTSESEWLAVRLYSPASGQLGHHTPEFIRAAMALRRNLQTTNDD